MSLFEAGQNTFLLDGMPVRIISGAIHYFRMVPEYWRDRLLKLKACGFNTVETYVAWNFHQPKPGIFHFEGMADIARFIEIAGELGLFVIVRPGPYICAEWENGGLPSWLMAEPGMRLRCCHRPFLEKVDAFFDVLLPKLTPLLCTKGGPIIAMQVENEYGSYGNDKEYLCYLEQGLIKRGVDVLLFTSDGPTDMMLQGGTLPGVLKTVNFGSKPGEAFEKLVRYQADKPLMCTEFWNGWFDHWGTEHHTRDPQDVAQVFESMLDAGASVNFYMFHGGTNFGFYSGANYNQKFLPTVTSYDYDSPLSEDGEPTEKFHAIKAVLSKYMDTDGTPLPEPIRKKGFGRVYLSEYARLMDVMDTLSVPAARPCPEPMEELGQDYGFILYRAQVTGPKMGCKLTIMDVHDRAQVFLDGQCKGIVERDSTAGIMLDIPAAGAVLDILVENMGRVNYGPCLGELKGITKGVLLDYQFLFGWTIYPLPLEDLSRVSYSSVRHAPAPSKEEPAFYKGILTIEEPADTFLSLKGWTKGVVFINGFNLGRYWNVGPQKTLYVPGPLLQKGDNVVEVFELHHTDELSIEFLDSPELG